MYKLSMFVKRIHKVKTLTLFCMKRSRSLMTLTISSSNMFQSVFRRSIILYRLYRYVCINVYAHKF